MVSKCVEGLLSSHTFYLMTIVFCFYGWEEKESYFWLIKVYSLDEDQQWSRNQLHGRFEHII